MKCIFGHFKISLPKEIILTQYHKVYIHNQNQSYLILLKNYKKTRITLYYTFIFFNGLLRDTDNFLFHYYRGKVK